MPSSFLGEISSPFRGQIEAEISLLGRYIKASEQGLSLAEAEQKRAIDEDASQIKGEALEVMMRYFGHASSFQEELPMVMRYGQVTAIYSVAEHSLGRIRDYLSESVNGIAEHLATLRYPHSLDASKKALMMGNGISPSDWEVIEQLALVRHCIVHCNGYLEDYKERYRDKIECLVEETGGLDTTDESRLLIEAAFVDASHQKIQELFETIFTNLKSGKGFRFSGGPRRTSLILDDKTNELQIVGPESPLEDRMALLEGVEPVALKLAEDIQSEGMEVP